MVHDVSPIENTARRGRARPGRLKNRLVREIRGQKGAGTATNSTNSTDKATAMGRKVPTIAFVGIISLLALLEKNRQ
jgi:hypothetical protein